jgi:hypothetical protein
VGQAADLMTRRFSVPGDTLATSAIVSMVGIAAVHFWAAQGHFAEAAEHAEMGMADEAAGLLWIARGLIVSVVAGLAVAAWGAFVVQRRRHLAAWTAVVVVGYSAMVAAGVASRTSVGLPGHTDPADTLWADTMDAEVAVVVLVAAYAAMVRGAQVGVIFGGAIGRGGDRVPVQ